MPLEPIDPWRTLDRSECPERFAGYLKQMDPFTRRVKALSHRLMRVPPGGRVLDVGCGLGQDVVAAACAAETAGLAVGVDTSRCLVNEAVAALPPTLGVVAFAQADGAELPFADCTFDASRTERLLQHVIDPSRVVHEMARVVRPGGRVLLTDTDHGTMTIGVPTPPALEEALHRSLAAGIRHPRVGRQLGRLLVEAGLVHCHARVLVNQGRRLQDFLSVEMLLQRAVDAGDLDLSDARLWLERVRLVEAQGALNWSYCSFVPVGVRGWDARKPTGREVVGGVQRDLGSPLRGREHPVHNASGRQDRSREADQGD